MINRLRGLSPRSRALGLILALATAGGLVAIGLAVTAQGEPVVPGAPQLTYARSWTLADLERHLQAGEVVAITAAAEAIESAGAGEGSTADGTVVAAKTVDGQFIRIELAQSPSEALVALRSLGYGRLFSAEAATALVEGQSLASGGGASVGSVFLMLAMIGIVIGSITIVARRSGRLPGAIGGHSFRTILPQAPRQPAAGEADATAVDAAAAAASVTFDDVAGCDEAKYELRETIDFLTDPARFTALGARVPRGILLYGPPGNGKTLMARAAASAAGVAFTYASGSEFVEKYVGVGASRVRALFEQARKAGRGIGFIDEIDALAKARGEGGHQETESTLNQLLIELDGFSGTDELVVMAATNRLDVLDTALLRPGRFTRKINVPPPDEEARLAILAVHARGKPLTADVDSG
jgi:hypothetical protein